MVGHPHGVLWLFLTATCSLVGNSSLGKPSAGCQLMLDLSWSF